MISVGWTAGLVLAGLYELGVQAPELRQRRETFEAARQFADSRRKPLLNVGCLKPLKQWWHPCGDVCLDTDATKEVTCRAPQFCTCSVLAIPFPDRTFGAATCFHVLEHMPTIGDVRRAISEMERVSDRVFILVPSRRGLRATFHEDHHLWLDWVPGGFCVQDRSTGVQETVAVRDPQPVPDSMLVGLAA